MPRSFVDRKGKIHTETDPDYATAKVHDLEQTVRDLMFAVCDLQLRLAKVDDGPVPWPADTYDPEDRGPD